jgi:signal transduction histidine kinase
VEDSYGVTVDVVTVGDAPIATPGEALAAAAREAMVNAAKHAGVDQVSLYVEIDDGRAVVFVRDRGKGFDPATVGEDRLGLRRSVTERMERHGGTSSVHSAPGEGTEVELEVTLA